MEISAIVVTRGPPEFSVVLVVGALVFYAANVVTRGPFEFFFCRCRRFASRCIFDYEGHRSRAIRTFSIVRSSRKVQRARFGAEESWSTPKASN